MAIESKLWLPTRSLKDQENIDRLRKKRKRNLWIMATIEVVSALICAGYLFQLTGSSLAFLFVILFLIPILFFPMRALIRVGYTAPWTGLHGYTRETKEYSPDGQLARVTLEPQPDKTLWDWILAIVIPVTLLAGILQFTLQQKNDFEKSIDQQQQVTLQNYLSNMSDLLLKEGLSASTPGSEVRAIAEAQTFTSVRNLDGNRKGTLIRFLWEANLLNRPHPIITLFYAGLVGANLTYANLNGIDLSGANLSGANLSGANLSGANLSGADLSGDNLTEASYNTKMMPWNDLQGNSITLMPTLWPQGFDRTGVELNCVDC